MRYGAPEGVKHLNPRQGITTIEYPRRRRRTEAPRVKHLNPRQGITTDRRDCVPAPAPVGGVKHLNPRQGITTEVVPPLADPVDAVLV